MLRHKQKPVLIVEDAADTRMALAEYLAIIGHRVATARDGIEALEYLRGHHHPVGVIVLDLCMPRMDGYAFLKAKAADARLRDIPVIVHSAMEPWHPLPPDVTYLRKGRTDPDQLVDAIAHEMS